MIFDTHVHSIASPDSKMCAKEAIHVLVQKGLGVVFTEHVDYIVSDGRDPNATDYWAKGKKDFVCNFDIYPSSYQNLRSASVLLGLEIGLTAAYFEKNKTTAEGDYDFILGSIHSVDGIDVYFDFPEDDVANFISRYLTYSREMVELCGFFDAFGHVDYVARYDAEAQKLFRYENFSREFDGLLLALAERDKAMEINTVGLSKFDQYEGILLPIYKRFAELGGKFCTLGSDTHDVSRLGQHIDKAKRLAESAGLTVVYYKGRKRYVCE